MIGYLEKSKSAHFFFFLSALKLSPKVTTMAGGSGNLQVNSCNYSQGVIGIVPLFTSSEWHKGKSILLSDRSVNSLQPIFTVVEVVEITPLLFLPLSPIWVVRSLIDVEPNGS